MLILVLPIKDIVGACYTYYTNINNVRIRYQALGLATKQTHTKIDVDVNYGDSFLEYLKEKNPNLEFVESNELSEIDFIDWVEKIQKK